MSAEYPDNSKGTILARKVRERHQKQRQSSLDAPICYDWAVVWRKNKPVAAFPTQEMAAGWIAESAHRSGDVISTWPNKKTMREYWAEAQRRHRAKAKSHNACVSDGAINPKI